MHKIKKYANRKMYDVTTKRYVTMDDIAELAQAGEEIIIIDNTSGKDITQEIVSQLVGRVLDTQAKKLPLSVLVELLRKGSSGLMDFSKKYVSFWQGALNYAEGELDKVNMLIDGAKSVKSDLNKSTSGSEPDPEAQLLELLDERIAQRLEALIQTRDGETRKQLSRLRSDITKLTARIEAFEQIFSQVLKIDKTRIPRS
jgi:polyhydroxyalkanoate synthesis repressor PhaR